MGGCGRQVGITFATKDTEVVVGGRNTKKGCVRCRGPKCLGRQNVEEVGSCLEGFTPVGGQKGGPKQKSAHNIVERTNEALSLTVLRRSVRTGHAEMHPMSEEERARAGVVELLAIVALNDLHCGTKLSSHVGKKVGERRKGVRFHFSFSRNVQV